MPDRARDLPHRASACHLVPRLASPDAPRMAPDGRARAERRAVADSARRQGPAPSTGHAAPGHAALPGDLAATMAVADGDAGGRIAVMRTINETAGNRAAGRVAEAARRSVQREDDDNPYAETTVALANGRFAGNKHLAEIANGGAALSKSDPSTAVKPVQTALLDLGYSLLRYKDDGSFGDETAQAIAQFRADRGVTDGDGMNAAALRRLDALAPAPGKQEQHYLDYDRLYGDGKLDVTLAIGYDEGESHFADLDRARAWMAANTLARVPVAPPAPAPGAPDVISGADVPAGDSAGTDPNRDVHRGFSTPETYTGKRSVTYPDKTGARVTKDITITVTLVPPGIGGKANFTKGITESELVFYNGHARRGIGPDFDADKSPYENFVIGVGSALHESGRVQAAGAVAESHYVINKKNDLEAMKGQWDPEKYRVWFFNACSSIAYFDELRGGLLPDKMDRHNLDLFGTTQSVPIAAGLAPVLANLEGILAADTMEGIVARMQAATIAAFRKALSDAGYSDDKINAALASYKGDMFLREGAGDNQVAP